MGAILSLWMLAGAVTGVSARPAVLEVIPEGAAGVVVLNDAAGAYARAAESAPAPSWLSGALWIADGLDVSGQAAVALMPLGAADDPADGLLVALPAADADKMMALWSARPVDGQVSAITIREREGFAATKEGYVLIAASDGLLRRALASTGSLGGRLDVRVRAELERADVFAWLVPSELLGRAVPTSALRPLASCGLTSAFLRTQRAVALTGTFGAGGMRVAGRFLADGSPGGTPLDSDSAGDGSAVGRVASASGEAAVVSSGGDADRAGDAGLAPVVESDDGSGEEPDAGAGEPSGGDRVLSLAVVADDSSELMASAARRLADGLAGSGVIEPTRLGEFSLHLVGLARQVRRADVRIERAGSGATAVYGIEVRLVLRESAESVRIALERIVRFMGIGPFTDARSDALARSLVYRQGGGAGGGDVIESNLSADAYVDLAALAGVFGQTRPRIDVALGTEVVTLRLGPGVGVPAASGTDEMVGAAEGVSVQLDAAAWEAFSGRLSSAGGGSAALSRWPGGELVLEGRTDGLGLHWTCMIPRAWLDRATSWQSP